MIKIPDCRTMIKIPDYRKPLSKDICVAMCFFRPLDYQNPVKNLNIVIDTLRKSDIPFYTIELLYKGQKNSIKNPTKTVHSNSILFSKENLWNILEKSIPKNYSKIIFLDADIQFDDPHWLDKSSKLLDQYDVIQSMEWCYRDIPNDNSNFIYDKKNIRPAIAKGIANNKKIDISIDYPGFTIGIKRDFFHKIEGFVEYALNGFGDSLFWNCFCDFESKCKSIIDIFPQFNDYKDNVIKNKKEKCVSYLQGCTAYHLYHGQYKNRRYGDRDHYIPKKFELFKNKYGVLEIKAENDLKQYWIDRIEDN